MESLGLILMIPFCVCFILLFVVCCFAEELKRMCRMPSQLPRSQTNARRHRSRRRGRRLYDLSGPGDGARIPSGEDGQALLRGRSRNESGDSTDTQSCPCNNVVIITNQSGMTSYVESKSFLNLAGLSASQTLRLPGPLSISQTVITHPIPAGEFGSTRSNLSFSLVGQNEQTASLGQSNLSFTIVAENNSTQNQGKS